MTNIVEVRATDEYEALRNLVKSQLEGYKLATRNAVVNLLATLPEQCAVCGEFKPGDELDYNTETDRHLCNDCIERPSSKQNVA